MRKGFAQILIIGLLVAVFVLAGAFYLKQTQKSQFQKKETENIINATPFPSASPQELCYFERINEVQYLKDTYKNFELDVSLLPRAAFNQARLGVQTCSENLYEIDMYGTSTAVESAARLRVYSVEKSDLPTLKEYAQTKTDYKAGQTIYNNENYKETKTSSDLAEEYFPYEPEVLSWTTEITYTPNNPSGSPAAEKTYLVKMEDKIFMFRVYAWNAQAFQKAISDFDKIILSFKRLD